MVKGNEHCLVLIILSESTHVSSNLHCSLSPYSPPHVTNGIWKISVVRLADAYSVIIGRTSVFLPFHLLVCFIFSSVLESLPVMFLPPPNLMPSVAWSLIHQGQEARAHPEKGQAVWQSLYLFWTSIPSAQCPLYSLWEASHPSWQNTDAERRLGNSSCCHDEHCRTPSMGETDVLVLFSLPWV